jgi:hypothetical protein
MFCPQCGHRQVSNEMRFCSRCGLPLDTVTDLLDGSAKTLQRKKREVTGISLMMATVLMLTNFIIVFGAITLPHLTNPVFLWIWASFVIVSLIIGGAGVTNLIRGGFFKRLKAREVSLNLMKNRPEVTEESESFVLDTDEMPRLVEPVSVTETTTRDLQAIPRFKE